ncbi:MAG: PDZ domain-containing protein [Planctomycetota bacterium]
MSTIQSTKALLWVGSLGLLGGLGYTVFDHISNQEVLAKELTAADYEPHLKDVVKPEPPKDDLIAYDKVLATFHKLDWSGKLPPPEKVAQADGPTEPEKPPVVPVASLVTVLMTQVDSQNPEESLAFIQLLLPALIQNSPSGDAKLVYTVGDALPQPHADVTVESITPGFVNFAFRDAAREPEAVEVKAPEAAIEWIVKLGPDDEVLAAVDGEGRIGKLDGPIFRPKQTYVRKSGLRNTEYVIGSEDKEIWSTRYADILANDVGYKRYRDPRTGKVTGVQITDVKPGSIAARHGVSGGEIIKSINGHAVTSVSDAISYAKQNANTTSTWIIVYEKQGREFTTTYQSN